ncbi:type VI secretion system tip protein TssI/VgrG [Fulvimarina sp. MAC3]|uniref:type VI secretion system Vgr family protein n=1 Tax=Fulvimarina sp. MAC3 TaxID=3148887 RepID=UPI0031FCB92A
MDGEEELSGDFEWRVEGLSQDVGIDLNELLGTHATVEVQTQFLPRYFDGIVCEAAQVGRTENGIRYDLVLRPWLHLATLRRNQRIFHDKTVVQIVEEVLQPYADHVGSPHFEVKLTEDYPILEYTVQYGESDADFCRRLLERFGISWSYIHEDGVHILRLTDHADAHEAIAGEARPYLGVERWHVGEEEHFREWHGGTRVTTGAVRLTEYNFKTPHAAQEVDRSSPTIKDDIRMESFYWPGDYLDRGEGSGVVARRLDQERGQAPRHRAKGDVAGLGAGTLVDLIGDPIPEITGERYICLKAVHRFKSQAYGTGESDDEERGYDGEFVLLPAEEPFRPERRTPRPFIKGPQTAKVVGEGEIDCDEYGRILVRYHWDLKGAYSMRCRVSQNWASKGWGGMVIPRIGMEVIVEHLEGDPDKPIVTGCVYNGANMPPYELPANKTRSVFKTDTHQGAGHNEIYMEDERGSEEIYFHAQKDMNTHVLNDRSSRIESDQHEFVGRNKTIQVGGDHEEVIAGNLSIAVGRNKLSEYLLSRTNNLFKSMGGLMEKIHIPDPFNFAKGNFQLFIEKNKSEIVHGGSSEIVGVAKSTVVGNVQQTTVGRQKSLIVRGRYDEDIGKVRKIRVGEELLIQVGETTEIRMKKDGTVSIKGTAIKLEAGTINLN